MVFTTHLVPAKILRRAASILLMQEEIDKTIGNEGANDRMGIRMRTSERRNYYREIDNISKASSEKSEQTMAMATSSIVPTLEPALDLVSASLACTYNLHLYAQDSSL